MVFLAHLPSYSKYDSLLLELSRVFKSSSLEELRFIMREIKLPLFHLQLATLVQLLLESLLV